MDSATPLPFECSRCAATNRPAARFCAGCGAPRFPVEQSEELTMTSSEELRAEHRNRFLFRMKHLRLQAWLFGLMLLSSLALGLYSHAVDLTVRAEAIAVGWDVAVVFAFGAAYWKDIRFLFVPRVPGLRPGLQVFFASIAILCAFELGFRALAMAGVPFVSFTASYVESGFPRWAVYAWLSVIPAVSEEVAFRGVIQEGLSHVGTKREALVIQSALFGVLHLSPIAFFTHTLMGLAFGWVRDRTRSIYPGMLIHAAWNAWIVFEETRGSF